MIKELKYLLFVVTIFLFVFFILKYYFSDENIKKSNIKIISYEKKLNKFVKELPLIESDTNNIIEYVDNNIKKKKEYSFWNLIK
tara:strand:+ start:1086 stop:1337 length:252 start_codon:yes stop_codon:yes gene_type:complete